MANFASEFLQHAVKRHEVSVSGPLPEGKENSNKPL